MTVVYIQYEQLHWCMVQQILDEEKSKHASSAQQNDIGPTLFHTILRLANCAAKPIVDWLHSLIGWVGVAISSLWPFAILNNKFNLSNRFSL